ncbi:MAG: thioredoxin [Nanoarchaeota archaeon]
MLKLNDESFKLNVEENQGIVVVDFAAEWCGPCKMFAPVFEEVSEGFKDVLFAKVDVDDAPKTAEKFGVQSVPTILFFKDGIEVDRFTGVLPKEDFVNKVQQQIQ